MVCNTFINKNEDAIKSKTKSFLIVSWSIILIFENLFFLSLDYDVVNLYIMSVVVIINFVIQSFILYRLHVNLISFFYAFIAFMYIFHYGQLITYTFYGNIDFDYNNYITSYIDRPDNMWKALRISLVVINGVFLGGLISLKHSRFIRISQRQKFLNDVFRRFGLFLFLFSFPFRLGIDAIQFYISMFMGYGATYEINLGSGVFSAIGGFWFVSVPIVYLCIKNNRVKNYFVTFCFMYMLVTMLSGHRGHQLISIVALFITIAIDKKMKINLKNILIYGLVAFVGLTFLDVIFSVRGYGFDYFSRHFGELLSDSFEHNIFIETLNDFGGTIFTPYLVVDGYGWSFSPFFGECFIKSFIQVIPDFTGSLQEINVSSIYPKMLNTEHMIGGSFVGEMYYNFGDQYWVFPIMFGWIIGSFSNHVEYSIRRSDFSGMGVRFPFLVYSLWWVRDAVGNFTRPIVWLLVFYYMVYHISKIGRRV